MERLVTAPGQEPQCEGCPSKLNDELKNGGYMCREVKVTNFGTLISGPKMIEDAISGSLICESRRPNLSTRIKSLVDRASVFAISRGIQLPQ